MKGLLVAIVLAAALAVGGWLWWNHVDMALTTVVISDMPVTAMCGSSPTKIQWEQGHVTVYYVSYCEVVDGMILGEDRNSRREVF